MTKNEKLYQLHQCKPLIFTFYKPNKKINLEQKMNNGPEFT